MKHDLKIAEPYYEAVRDGSKNFEIRYNDRDYKVGHIVNLRRIPNNPLAFRPKITVIITYVTDFEQKEGWVVFGFKRVKV